MQIVRVLSRALFTRTLQASVFLFYLLWAERNFGKSIYSFFARIEDLSQSQEV